MSLSCRGRPGNEGGGALLAQSKRAMEAGGLVQPGLLPYDACTFVVTQCFFAHCMCHSFVSGCRVGMLANLAQNRHLLCGHVCVRQLRCAWRRQVCRRKHALLVGRLVLPLGLPLVWLCIGGPAPAYHMSLLRTSTVALAAHTFCHSVRLSGPFCSYLCSRPEVRSLTRLLAPPHPVEFRIILGWEPAAFKGNGVHLVLYHVVCYFVSGAIVLRQHGQVIRSALT